MNDNTLLTSRVPRTLDTKSKILGLELTDVLLLLLNVSIQNLIFGSTSMKIPMVFGTSILMAGLLFFVKRGKPDLYLQHLAQHLMAPTVRVANSGDKKYQPFSKGGF
jgi:hypothetical protein